MGAAPALGNLAQSFPRLRARARTRTDRIAGRGTTCCRAWRRSGLAEAKQPLGALLLEVQGAGRQWLDPPDAPAELGHVGPDPGVGEHPEPEGERNRADVIPSLQGHAERDGGKVGISELPVLACQRRVGGTGRGLCAEPPGVGSSPGGLRAGPPGSEPSRGEHSRRGPSRGGPSNSVPQRRQQPERLAVPEHPRGHVQPAGRLGDAHGR